MTAPTTTTTLDSSGAYMVLRTRAGVDLHFVVEVADADDGPMDLTGYVVLAVAYPDTAAGAPAEPVLLDAELDGPAGTVTVRLTAAVTATLRSCRYSVALESPTGVVHALFHGPIQIDQVYPA